MLKYSDLSNVRTLPNGRWQMSLYLKTPGIPINNKGMIDRKLGRLLESNIWQETAGIFASVRGSHCIISNSLGSEIFM